jgi:hypothetical protein
MILKALYPARIFLFRVRFNLPLLGVVIDYYLEDRS